jgi:hypothetical protein
MMAVCLTDNCIRFGCYLIKEEKENDYPLASFYLLCHKSMEIAWNLPS